LRKFYPNSFLCDQASDRAGCYSCRKREAPDPRVPHGVPAKVSHGHHGHGHGHGHGHYGHAGHYAMFPGWAGHHPHPPNPIPGANKG